MNTHPSEKTNSSDLTEPMEKEGGIVFCFYFIVAEETERREATK